MKHRFPINGLRHHDFKGRLDELYELAPGKHMSISIERDNPVEKNAVIVYYGSKFVGYVRSCNRPLAYGLIMASGRGALLGKITGVDRTNRWLCMEISSEDKPCLKQEHTHTVLDNWHFDGELLPSDEAELRLHTMLCNLEMTIEQQDPWDENMEQWLAYTEQNLWQDISCETYTQVTSILDLLTDGSEVHQEYKQKIGRLQLAIDAMGSPEVRKKQAMLIIEKAKSKEMDLLLAHYGDQAKDCLRQLPEKVTSLFMEDGKLLMGRLWYLHRPYKQLQELKTLLAMLVRLTADTNKDKSEGTDSISEQWLLGWATRQKDKTKADVVREIIDTFEMEHVKPKLAQQVQRMVDECNAPSQPTTQINQLNMGNGTQLPPPDVNIPKLPKQ